MGKKWQRIDAQLIGEHLENPNDGDNQWLDEQNGEGWVKTPVKINVPFHH
jgi:hypothetical protein